MRSLLVLGPGGLTFLLALMHLHYGATTYACSRRDFVEGKYQYPGLHAATRVVFSSGPVSSWLIGQRRKLVRGPRIGGTALSDVCVCISMCLVFEITCNPCNSRALAYLSPGGFARGLTLLFSDRATPLSAAEGFHEWNAPAPRPP